MEKFSESIIATVLFLSNFYFWRDSGYFALIAEERPLLHTWSLAVEEQFYLLFPLLLLLVWRGRGRSAVWWITLLAIGSLLVSEWGWRTDPVKNFLFTGSRMWELLAGSLCAVYRLKKDPEPGNLMSALGLSLILYPMFTFSSETPFPSLYTLAPVGGAALILLFTDSKTLVGQALSMRPVVWVGLISYSAYLWHQPLFAFAYIYSINSPQPLTMAALSVLVLPLAYLSWRFIEQPMRKRGATVGRRGVFALSGIGITCLLMVGLYGDKSGGFPERLSPDVLAFYNKSGWHKNCLYQKGDGLQFLPNTKCTYNIGGTHRIAIFGDSVAASLSGEIAAALKNLDIEVHQVTFGSCIPVTNLVRSSQEGISLCPKFTQSVVSLIQSEGFDAVVLSANWAAYLENPATLTHMAGNGFNFQNAFSNMVSDFNTPTVIILPHAIAPYEVVDAAVRTYQRTGLNPELGIDKHQFQSNTLNTANQLALAVSATKIDALDPSKIFCDVQIPSQCAFSSGGHAFISDEIHYTSSGAKYVANALVPLITSIMNSKISE